MRVTTAITLLLALHSAEAFAPFPRAAITTSRLYEHQMLEGRKIAGDVVPMGNFVLVKTVGIKEKTDEGIFLAGKAKIVKTEGSVISVGPGKSHADSGKLQEVPLSPGDKVIYGKYDGIEIDLNGKPHMLIRDENVLVKYTGDKLSLDSVEVIRDNVLVYIDLKDQQTAGGILLATSKTGENRPSTGTVVKIGPGKMAGDGSIIPMRVGIGDKVKFRDFGGTEVEIGGEEHSVVKMEDILAIF
jgi:chaperonin GroES